MSGTASCVRMISASTPANSMKPNAVSVYHTPIRLLLTSVQRKNQPDRRLPHCAQPILLRLADRGIILVVGAYWVLSVAHFSP